MFAEKFLTLSGIDTSLRTHEKIQTLSCHLGPAVRQRTGPYRPPRGRLHPVGHLRALPAPPGRGRASRSAGRTNTAFRSRSRPVRKGSLRRISSTNTIISSRTRSKGSAYRSTSTRAPRRPCMHKTASDFFRTLYDKGEFTEKTTMQYYDEEAGQFLADRYIVGHLPPLPQRTAPTATSARSAAARCTPDRPDRTRAARSSGSPLRCMRETDALVPAARQARGLSCASGFSKGTRSGKSQRLRAVQELARSGTAAACREPRSGLGDSRSGRGSRGQSARTSGSTRRSAISRPRRN